MTKRKPLVYLAGPYTLGDPEINARCQGRIMTQLVKDGRVVPFSPLAHSHAAHTVDPQPYESWMDHSFGLLSRCDYLLRMPASEGDYFEDRSAGADREEEFAKANGIPVFYDISHLLLYVMAQPYGAWPSGCPRTQPAEPEPQPTQPATVRTFATGATRDTDTDKPDYEGFLSPLVIAAFGRYMHANRKQADGKLRDSDNWQKGIELNVYMKSAWRHFMEWWTAHRAGQDTESAICALLFNAMGYLHEYLKAKHNASSDKATTPSIEDHNPNYFCATAGARSDRRMGADRTILNAG